MECVTPGASSNVSGVTPRKLPPVSTCAPEGTDRTVTLASAAPSVIGPMVCGTPAFTTTLEVRVSPDLKHARVFVSSLGAPGARTVAVEGLNHAAPFLRRALGRSVALRYVPELTFVEDTTLEQGERVERLLRDIHEAERDADADHDD